MVVPREVSVTYSHSAGIVGCPSTSVRRNTMPWSAGAGLTVIVTNTPVCKPLPENVISEQSVCCFVDEVVVIFYGLILMVEKYWVQIYKNFGINANFAVVKLH
jgi:hypothetical protein